ncbi:uncharacterized protein [Pocillopora verrucosa]|uniref:uncharacterized protein n=1 Tax=Pocillopora verrucosa TaxID=203993 RepID=UPI002797795F|nr:uncharacterized protein LOC131782087 [Pocillopora verrucosa]
MELKKMFPIVVVCLVVLVDFSESNERKNKTLKSAICDALTTKACLMKIQRCSTSQRKCQVRVNGTTTTDPAARFTIVRVYKSTPNITKCIEVTSPSHVKYAMKVDSINSIIFEEQQNGCNNKTADAFIFTEARDSDSGYFTYTHNSRCLGTNIDGTLSLMTISDANTKKCSFKHIKWPLLR